MNCSTRHSLTRHPRQRTRHASGCGTDCGAWGVGALTITDSDTHTRLEFDVPGFDTDDISIDLQDGRLVVSGEVTATREDEQVVYDERSRRSFRRVVRVSDKLDPASADAELRDGVLTLTLARKPEAERRRVEIRGGSVSDAE